MKTIKIYTAENKESEFEEWIKKKDVLELIDEMEVNSINQGLDLVKLKQKIQG